MWALYGGWAARCKKPAKDVPGSVPEVYHCPRMPLTDPMIGPALAVVAYLLGSVSFGLVIAGRRGVDLRAIGSGNIGATNVSRALGKKTGRLVMVLDMLKGLIPVVVARWVLDLDWPWIAATGWAATIGHVFPIWHALRGGKGAATAGGVLLGALPDVGVLSLLAFLVARKMSRRASVASLLSGTVGTFAALALYGEGWPFYLAAGLWFIVVLRHYENIGRLLRGEEPPTAF